MALQIEGGLNPWLWNVTKFPQTEISGFFLAKKKKNTAYEVTAAHKQCNNIIMNLYKS